MFALSKICLHPLLELMQTKENLYRSGRVRLRELFSEVMTFPLNGINSEKISALNLRIILANRMCAASINDIFCQKLAKNPTSFLKKSFSKNTSTRLYNSDAHRELGAAQYGRW